MRETINEMRYVDHHSMKESKNFSDFALFPHIKRFLSPAIVKLLTRRAYSRLVRKNVQTSRSLLLTFIAPGIPQNDSPSAAPEAKEAFHSCLLMSLNTESEQDPQKPSNIRAIYQHICETSDEGFKH
jgi:hypothetical protein